MYPHERSLVKQLADQPFALVGVNSDQDLEEIREIVKEKNLTWRSFQNEQDDSTIADDWASKGGQPFSSWIRKESFAGRVTAPMTK